MRISRTMTIIFAGAALLVLLTAAYLISRPFGAVVTDASFSLERISPNADGVDDITTFSYRVRRLATISIYFEDQDGERRYFRQENVRARDEYSVLFSGVVDGYVNEGEEINGEVLTRLLPDGEYTWVIEATDHVTNKVEFTTGTLVIEDSDTQLPELYDFSVTPDVFTPNQDGLDDVVWINVYIPKPADLSVFLIDSEGQRYYISESQEGRLAGEEGRHTYSYDGGVDMGRTPPPDGTYTVRVEAQDAEGQRVLAEREVTITFGGLPLAEIVGQPVGDTIEFSSSVVVIGDILTFELTVENYGDAPLRTSGPEPGYVYEQDELYSATGFLQESGVWRIGIHCDTCLTDYPWRWAVGSYDELTAMEVDGHTQYYLMPGQRAVITGGIRLTDAVESRNPQQFWAGLIHEDVGIAPLNNFVDPHWIKIELATD